LKEFERVVWKIHKYRKKVVLSNISKDWDLFMAWFDLADCIGHLYMGRSILKILKAYLELDRLATNLKTMVGDDTLFIIVSDHGMMPGGKHSDRAFYSFSNDIARRPNKIEDFYLLIIDLLNRRCA